MKLDALHSQILEQLQRNARISNTAIAHQVGISSPAVTERIKKLGGCRNYRWLLCQSFSF